MTTQSDETATFCTSSGKKRKRRHLAASYRHTDVTRRPPKTALPDGSKLLTCRSLCGIVLYVVKRSTVRVLFCSPVSNSVRVGSESHNHRSFAAPRAPSTRRDRLTRRSVPRRWFCSAADTRTSFVAFHHSDRCRCSHPPITDRWRPRAVPVCLGP